jgi:hypothetical protein
LTVGLTSLRRRTNPGRGENDTKKRAMRKRYRVLIFAALVAALVVPVGYALSIDSKPKTTHARYDLIPVANVTAVAAPAMMPHVGDSTSVTILSPLSDAAKLLCIGTVLFGLAAAVRKTI